MTFPLYRGSISIVFSVFLLGTGSNLPLTARAAPPDRQIATLFSSTSDSSGVLETVAIGSVNSNGPFFQKLGTNGRSCVSCHVASEGFTITPAGLASRFEATQGRDPAFRPNDGSNCAGVDPSDLSARRDAYSILLSKGLIRVGLKLPSGAEFTLLNVDDPHGCAPSEELSLFRRPLPTTSLRFLSGVMWDGRETTPGNTMRENLLKQALDATMGHAQATLPPTPAQLNEIVDFESALFTAQATDDRAGRLDIGGATGGPAALSRQPFFIGINDPLNPAVIFNSDVFTLFTRWEKFNGASGHPRARIARGEKIFNSKPIFVTGVRGLNDKLGVNRLQVTCTTCHNTPNSGNHSVVLPLDIGLTDASRRTPDMPLYTFRCETTGEVIQTTDPGRAMITGKCGDISRFKGPILRGLASRAPYFHNGFAPTLKKVVEFYDERFGVGFTEEEKEDLAAFLRAL